MAHLLIVDDDEDFAGAARMMLQSRGFDVAMEYDTARIMARLDQRLPDVLLLDVMFPENPMGGIELAREVHERYPQLPMLILSAVNQSFPYGFQGERIDPAALPVVDFIEKPVDFRVLCDKLDRLLHRPTIATEESAE
jgi:DNA-binding response OmpR family regulator